MRRYRLGIRADHDWGKHFDPEPDNDVLECLAEMAPRDMRRALMTGFGNARLAGQRTLKVDDIPKASQGKSKIGFMQ